MSNCTLCNLEVELLPVDRDIIKYNCRRCGAVEMSGMMSAVFINNREYDNIKYMLSGVTRYRTENNLPTVTILSGNLQELLDSPFVPRNITDKSNLILKYLAKKSKSPGDRIGILYSIDYPIAFAKGVPEIQFYFESLKSQNLIEPLNQVIPEWRLTIDGWNRIQELDKKITKKRQAFIAMWFDELMSEIYKKGFRRAVVDCGYEPMRIDLKDHNNKIDDEIMVEIRNSGFMIADFTGDRGGVYFEAGFAKGLGLDVIWTCRKDELEKVHFDTRQFNHIVWENEEELYKSLVNRIKNTITI